MFILTHYCSSNGLQKEAILIEVNAPRVLKEWRRTGWEESILLVLMWWLEGHVCLKNKDKHDWIQESGFISCLFFIKFILTFLPSAGISDQDILNLVNQEEAILLTADKDFGEVVLSIKRMNIYHKISTTIQKSPHLSMYNRSVRYVMPADGCAAQ